VEQYWDDVNSITWTCISGVRPALASASVSQMQQSQLMNKLRLKFCKCACLQLNSNCKLSCDYCKLSSAEFADILLWILFFFPFVVCWKLVKRFRGHGIFVYNMQNRMHKTVAPGSIPVGPSVTDVTLQSSGLHLLIKDSFKAVHKRGLEWTSTHQRPNWRTAWALQ
jgi:hypothetical protein